MCGKKRFSECEGIAKCLVQCLFYILVTKYVFLDFKKSKVDIQEL